MKIAITIKTHIYLYYFNSFVRFSFPGYPTIPSLTGRLQQKWIVYNCKGACISIFKIAFSLPLLNVHVFVVVVKYFLKYTTRSMHYLRAHRAHKEGIFLFLLYISFAHFCVLCMSENFFAFKYEMYAFHSVMVYHERTSELKVIYRPNLESRQKELFSAFPVSMHIFSIR